MYNSSKSRGDKPLLNKEVNGNFSVKECLTTQYFLDLYQRTCRGFQLRNWKAVFRVLKTQRCPSDVLKVIYLSWVKFKFARAIRPERSSIYVYIMKNFSTLEGQKIYDDCYEQFTEQPYGTTKLFYERRGRDTRYFRLMEYFYNEQPEWILPLTVFPLIDFEKSKMDASFIPFELDMDIYNEVFQKVFNYIYELDIKSLFIPRPDVMQKYGTQRYNDGGTVRFDYERPTTSFDSGFMYQRFLTQPLTPREVWLPGKAIKQNNAFFMNIHRQILQKDPVYPSIDTVQNWDRLQEVLEKGCWKFDISAFGFQYIREWLMAANNAIRELYPCSYIEEQSEIFNTILNSVNVMMPNGDVVRPPRGIGLGYYEDLKTIVMCALLKPHYPVSIYGDQGIIKKEGIEFAFELMKYSFIMNYEKLDEGSSEGRLRWGGIVFNKDSPPFKPRLYTDSIFGSFFARHHWERKASLYSFYKHYPEEYKAIENRLVILYDRVYGHEFFFKECYTSFLDGGISTIPRCAGVSKTYDMRRYMTPINMLTYDPIYQTPFSLINPTGITMKMSREFSKKRRRHFVHGTPKCSMLFDYVEPIIEFNKKQHMIPRTLPRWADLSLALLENASSGSLTCGLSKEEIKNAVERQYFASDPFRARATGGYSFTTKWRSSRPPPHEWLETGEILCELTDVSSMYVNRTDLVQNPMLNEDPMYYNSDLFKGIIEKVSKRKRRPSSLGDDDRVNRLSDEVNQLLPSLIKRNKVTDFTSIIKLAEERLEVYDRNYEVELSDHGDYDADDAFFADNVDLTYLE